MADLSFGEWLAAEERSERRHELVGGRIYLMAGGTERHDLAAGLLYELLALSPSTADVDRREKATAFAAIAGLETLLLVDPDIPRAEGARLVGGRVAGWDTFGPGDAITTPFGETDIDALHDQIDATAST